MIRDRAVVGRYASALFGAALARNELQQADTDVRALEALYRKDPRLQEFLEAPNVLDGDKVRIVRAVLQGQVSELVLQFVLLMLRKKRVQHLPLVFEPFQRLVEQHLGMERAEVVTAVPMIEEQSQRLLARLEAMTGKKIALVTKIDPAILGGAVVTVAGKILDGSVRHKLDRMRDELLSVKVH